MVTDTKAEQRNGCTLTYQVAEICHWFVALALKRRRVRREMRWRWTWNVLSTVERMDRAGLIQWIERPALASSHHLMRILREIVSPSSSTFR
jgi:hypothetical protein